MNRKLAKMFVASWLLLALTSCSNEVDVIGVWKDIPVVYGIMGRLDSANYIRIERAYLPPNKSALDVAKDVDSLYFDPNELDVEIWMLRPNGDTLPWRFPITRVDLRDEGFTREEGIFQHEPAYAYKTRDWTDSDILLKLHHHKTGNTFYAQTETVRSDQSLILLTPTYSRNPSRPFTWRGVDPSGDEVYNTVVIDVLTSFASIYDYKFRFHYDEYEVDGQGVEVPGTRKDQSIVWRAVGDFIPSSGGQNKRTVNGESFYRFLGQNLSDVTGTNTRRCAGALEVFVVGGAASVRDYVLARKANEGFVGGLYPADPYSNIVGGLGFFATSDILERKDRPADPRMMDMSPLSYEHLSTGEFTNMLGFESSTPCF
ncbi:MAG: hypothetical protein ACRBFS_15420 [Aureispira sp.]